MVTLAETKSEDQWQSEATRSKLLENGCYHCKLHLKIGHGREERHRKESHVIFIPKKVLTFCSSPVKKLTRIKREIGIAEKSHETKGITGVVIHVCKPQIPILTCLKMTELNLNLNYIRHSRSSI